MPKGVTSLLSDGAAKRTDPGVKMPKKGTPNSKNTSRSRLGAYEGGLDAFPRDRSGMRAKGKEQFRVGIENDIARNDIKGVVSTPSPAAAHRTITRPDRTNTRARAAGALLSRMKK